MHGLRCGAAELPGIFLTVKWDVMPITEKPDLRAHFGTEGNPCRQMSALHHAFVVHGMCASGLRERRVAALLPVHRAPRQYFDLMAYVRPMVNWKELRLVGGMVAGGLLR